MDFSVDEDSRALIASLTDAFAGIAARAQKVDESAELPPENLREVMDSGYPRIFHPAEIGGLGVDGVTQAMAMEALARACPSTYWSATMSTLVCAKLIHTYGDPGHTRELLDGLVSGRRLGCFPVVELTSGSDAETYRTIVRPTGDGGYTISGEKARITNATNADLAVVFSRLEGGPEQWCYAFVDLRQPGVRTYRMPSMGLRAMPWGGLVFEDARIEPACVAPLRAEQFPEGMAWGWLFISISAIATAEAALDAAVEHARGQLSFGRELAHMEQIQALIARSRVEIEAARLLAYRCSWHRTEGRLVQDLVGMLKPYATEMAVRVTQHAVQILGSWGLTPGHPVERHYRDAPMNVIGGFASNRLRELVAGLLGMPPAYQEFDRLEGTGLELDLIGALR